MKTFYSTNQHSEKTEQARLHIHKSIFTLLAALFFGGAWGQNVQETFASSGTWTCPSGVTSITVECWGGGGAGGNASHSGSGQSRAGGGAGGSYVRKSITVVPGTSYNFTIGSGGSNSDGGVTWFFNTSTVLATGGQKGTNANKTNSLGGIGSTTGCVGDVIKRGGNGGSATPSASGGGGGGAGSSSTNGSDANDQSGGIATDDFGGSGANGRTDNGVGNSCTSTYGGGGAGAFISANPGTATSGGDGAPGFIRITYAAGSPPTITSAPTSLCSAGGQTVTISGENFIGATAFTFNGVAASSFSVTNATTISAVTPANVTAGVITVTTPAGSASSSAYTVTTTPDAVSVSGGGTVCNSATLVATGGSGGTIYWQNTTNNGTSTATASTSQIVSTNGTYFFRAENNGCWGAQGSAMVTITSAPSITSQPANQIVSTQQTATFSVTASGAGLTYAWQEFNGSTWSNISNGGVYAGATTTSLTITNPPVSMTGNQYRCIVTGACAPNATSNAANLTVTLNYCSPTFTSGVEPISNVQFNSINNSSGNTCGSGLSLEDFTSVSTSVVAGTQYTISVTGNTCGNYTNHFRVYFDWNQNASLTDEGESYYIGTIVNNAAGTLTLNITIPANAQLGSTRMRVMKRYNADPTNPCLTGAGFGQAEDYTINIIAPTGCSGIPNLSELIASSPSSCANINVSSTLSLETQLLETGYTYQWQESTNNTTWTDIPGATNSTYLVTLTSQTKYFRLRVTCSNGNAVAFTNSRVVYYDCSAYCPQGGSTAGTRFISNVNYNSINRTSTFDGYINTGLSTSVILSTSSTLSVTTPTSSSTYYSAAWIDWNGDGDFNDENENVMVSLVHPNVAGASTRNITVTVPSNATLGPTRMRIKTKFNSAITGPCEAVLANDDVEDYTIIICANPTITSPTSDASITACSSENLSLSVLATTPEGSGNLSYQWQVNTGSGFSNLANGGIYSNVNTATLNITNVPTSINGFVYRCVLSNSCGGSATSATTTINVGAAPTASAGGSVAICDNVTTTVTGASASNGTILWTHNGTGSLINTTTLTPTYTPVTGESGAVTLTMTVTGTNTGCTSNTATANFIVNVSPNPTAIAGPALAAICPNGTSAAMGGSVGGSATGGTWSGGAGTWTNANDPATAIYTAGSSESGTITLTLTTSGGSCGTTSVTKTIVVNQNPTASAGPALAAICQSATSAAMGGSVGGGATGGTWSGGAGTWTNANNPATATYTADASESGTITLTLTTSGGSCGTTAVTKTIQVNQTSIVNSGVSESSPTLCLSTPLTAITHTTAHVTGIASSMGLPEGVTASYANNVITISGTPATSGTYNYSITPQGCGAATATGQIVVQAPEPVIVVEENTATVGDYIWNGLVSNDWNQVANWYVKTGSDSYASAAIAPTLQDNVFIVPNSIGGTCVSNANNPVVNVLTLGSGTSSDVIVHPLAQLTLSPNTVLNVSGNFECYGAISFGAGSKLKFTGNDSTTFHVANPANSIIYNLEMNKTNTLVLLSDMHVSNEVLFNEGNIRLNLKTMDLGSTGFFTNENENSYAYCDCPSAKIVRTVTIDADETVNAGNLGLSITPELSMGTVRVERRHRKIIEPFNGLSQSITRYYSVKDINGGSVQNNGDLNATLVFQYLNAESNFGAAQLSLYHQSAPESFWSNLNGDHDPAGKTVTLNNFQSFSFVTLGPSGSALPVSLISFNANCEEDKVNISWTTASEYNASHFTLQSSRDGITWTEVAEIAAAGTTNQTSHYFYQDNNLNGVSYYRLVQTDFDGTFEVFGAISVNCEFDQSSMSVYPNPSAGDFVLTIQTTEQFGDAEIEMVDLSGRIIQSKALDIAPGSTAIHFETHGLQPGTYLIRVKGQNNKLSPVRVVVM